MGVSFPQLGHKVMIRVVDMEGECTIGMKKGDEFEVSIYKCGDFCGYFYHHVFNWICLLQFDGAFPLGKDADTIEAECPNFENRVRVELKRIVE